VPLGLRLGLATYHNSLEKVTKSVKKFSFYYKISARVQTTSKQKTFQNLKGAYAFIVQTRQLQ
jgi:hypothetical protein